jgi:hypothetical protein
MRHLNHLLALSLIAVNLSCATNKSDTIRWIGHYNFGSGPGLFVPDSEPNIQYLLLAGDTPDIVLNFLKTQPRAKDLKRESEWSTSALADVEGSLSHDKNGTARFITTKVFSISEARPSFVESRGKWPPATHFKKQSTSYQLRETGSGCDN